MLAAFDLSCWILVSIASIERNVLPDEYSDPNLKMKRVIYGIVAMSDVLCIKYVLVYLCM